jgi:hypothetical protein
MSYAAIRVGVLTSATQWDPMIHMEITGVNVSATYHACAIIHLKQHELIDSLYEGASSPRAALMLAATTIHPVFPRIALRVFTDRLHVSRTIDTVVLGDQLRVRHAPGLAFGGPLRIMSGLASPTALPCQLRIFRSLRGGPLSCLGPQTLFTSSGTAESALWVRVELLQRFRKSASTANLGHRWSPAMLMPAMKVP